MTEGIWIAIIPASVTMFGLIFGYFTNKNIKSNKKKEDAEISRQEMNRNIGRLRNEKEIVEDEKTIAEDERNSAESKLLNQMASCMASGNDIKKLAPLIQESQKASQEYQEVVKEWKKISRKLYKEMDEIWKESEGNG